MTDTLQGFGTDFSVSVSGQKGAMIGAVRADSDDSPNVASYLKFRDFNDKTSTQDVQVSGQLSDLTESLRDFVGAVESRRKPSITVDDGFVSLAICEAALKSMQSGKAELVERL